MFRSPHLPPVAEAARDYERERGSASSRGYDARWVTAADGHKRAHPLCVGCDAMGFVRAAYAVDHIVPHRGDQLLFWDRGNWQSACAWHHAQVKARLEQMWDRGEIGRDALPLGSAVAVALARKLLGPGRVPPL